MCGIAGILSFGEPPVRAHLDAMTGRLVHRGPDDQGFFASGPCALGFRRLSIIDLSTGQQPMTFEDATVVFNGELYNFRELRSELERLGHAFRTTSDTEVLLHAYAQWGEDALERVDGMFAFALWDAVKRRLLLARDRFGKKPLYYAWNGTRLLFASELKALLAHPGCPRKLDGAALRRYLAFEYVPTPHSIFEGIHKVREAHTVGVHANGLVERRYFTPPGLAPQDVPLADAVARFRELFTEAVRKRLVSDVPLGVFLSGGIDSSAITAFAAREVTRLKTFSIAVDDEAFDESAFARRAAAAFGTEHHEERLTARDCLDLLPRAAAQLDEPFADPSYLPTHLLSRFTRESVTVALGGDGADELFGGYDTFVAEPFADVYTRLPKAAQDLAARAARMLPSRHGYMSFDFRVRTFLSGAGTPARYRLQNWLAAFQPPALDRLLTLPWRGPGVYDDIDALAKECPAAGVAWALRYYFGVYLRDDILTKVDRASMAASLEVRSPFLDTALVQFVMSLPVRLRTRPFKRKWLLKKALAGIVPRDILHRKKHGFALPVTAWLKGPLRPLLEDLFEPRALRGAGIFEPAEVRRLMTEHFDGQVDHRKPLWTLMMFELWRRQWL